MTKHIMPEIKNILYALLERQRISKEIDEFFRLHSKFWKMFEKHLLSYKVGECPFFNNSEFKYFKGQGPISLKTVYAHAPGANSPCDTIRFTYYVYMVDEDGVDIGTTVVMDVPEYLVLLDNQDELDVSFKEWILEEEKKWTEIRIGRIKSQIKELDIEYNKLTNLLINGYVFES